MKPENRKEEIVIIAARLFKEKGYSAVTMRDIAKTMGIKAASLYNHISSKQEILTDIIIALAEEFTQGMRSIKSSNSNSLDKLRKIVKLHVDITARNTFGMASLNNDWMHLEEQLGHYLKLRHNYEDDLRNIINQGVNTAEIANFNPDIMLFSMLSTLRSLYLWIPKKEDLNPNELANELSKVFINGIKK